MGDSDFWSYWLSPASLKAIISGNHWNGASHASEAGFQMFDWGNFSSQETWVRRLEHRGGT